MSVPKELLESLLSAYMDDVLSADERIRVEQMLARDAVLRGQLEEMLLNRQILQQIHVLDSHYKLPHDFAQSVIEATVERARSEGLSDTHPVLRLAEQPNSELPASDWNRSRSIWKIAASIAALAASVAIVVVAIRGSSDNETVALQNSAIVAPSPDVPSTDDTDLKTGDLDATVPEPTPSMPLPAARLAVSDDIRVDSENGVALEMPQLDATVDDPVSLPSREAIASVIPDSMPLVSATTEAKPMATVSAILVLDVRLTMDGRENGAVENAMQHAGIQAASRKSIDDEVVLFAKQTTESVDADSESATVLYLEAPMKELDLLFLQLVDDVKGIESVRMSLATDAPLVQFVNSIRAVDPTTIQHQGQSWQLDAGDEGSYALASHLSNRPFAGLDNASAAMGVVSSMNTAVSTSESNDVLASVLVVVH